MEKIQKICVSAFIHNEGKVLILKRSMNETFLPGNWDVPGGKLNFGETPEEGLKREAREEANLEIEVVKPYNLFSYMSKEGAWHNVDIQFIAKITGDINNLKLSKDHDEYRWITEEEIEAYLDISNNMKNALKKGFQEINKS